MYATSTSTSTDTWDGSGWIISPGHRIGVIDVPPPSTADALVAEPFPSEARLAYVLQVLEIDEYLDLIEDLNVARKAIEDYAANGTDGTVLYSEYRDQRFGRSG